jgi:hypothetical protein
MKEKWGYSGKIRLHKHTLIIASRRLAIVVAPSSVVSRFFACHVTSQARAPDDVI